MNEIGSSWFYARQGARHGPFAVDALVTELRSGFTHPTEVLVWRKGLPGWVNAGTLPEIATLITASDSEEGESQRETQGRAQSRTDPAPAIASTGFGGIGNRVSEALRGLGPATLEATPTPAAPQEATEASVGQEADAEESVEEPLASPEPPSPLEPTSPQPPQEENGPPARDTSSSQVSLGALVAALVGIGVVFLLVVEITSVGQKPRPSGPSAPTAAGQSDGLSPVRDRDAATWNDLGHKAAEQSDWPMAVRDYEKAALLAPSDPVVLGNLGMAYSHEGRHDQAIVALEKALVAGPEASDRAHLLLWLASSEIVTGLYSQGLGHADQAIDLSSENAVAHYWKARALASLGRSNDAIASARTALTLKNDFAAAHSLLQTLEQKANEAQAQYAQPTVATPLAHAGGVPISSVPRRATVTAPLGPRPVRVPTGGRWANSQLGPEQRESYLRACLAATRTYADGSGYAYPCDEDNLTAEQATTLLLHRLVDGREYSDAIALYKEAAPLQPRLKSRVANLVAVCRERGLLEVAYCLDPSNDSIRAEFENSASERRGYCAEAALASEQPAPAEPKVPPSTNAPATKPNGGSQGEAVGRLKVLTEPAGAEVFIGSLRVGTTTADGVVLELPVGVVSVSVRKLGYLPAERKVLVEANNELLLPLFLHASEEH